MPNKYQDALLYHLEYPSYLQPATRLWVSKEGDVLRRNGIAYEIVQVVRPIIKGSKPRLVIAPYAEDTNNSVIPF